MKVESLAGEWQFKSLNPEKGDIGIEWMPATVPGGVHTDLLALDKIPDPFAADHELDVQWVAQSDWEYRRKFKVSTELLKAEKVFLVCDGIDTLAEVFLNGFQIGITQNMFRQYRWEVKDHLRNSENEIVVRFQSPVNFISERNNIEPLIGVSQAIPGGPHLRKAPCQFGWDWGPMLPPVGIWKDIRLEGFDCARIDEIHFRQYHSRDRVKVTADYKIEHWAGGEFSAQMVVTEPESGEVLLSDIFVGTEGKVSVDIAKPKLWWPNGYGKQPLYRTSFILRSGTTIVDQREVRLGLRTVEVNQQPDRWGTSFTFIINGVPIFAKGSNWIPADSFPTRLSDEKLRYLLKSAAVTHQNMLRVWGGGFYEDERFYDLCDEMGILVWQDMIFSCSIYPFGSEDFLENVKQEILQNVRRLRHRASLALWCGNNEMEVGWTSWGWMQRAGSYRDSYDRFFHKILPAWIAELDPDRNYWPSSPSSNKPFEDVNGQSIGDAHYWDVWHGRKPFTAYRGQYPRFMSEFGFQSLPPFETVKTYASEADLNMTSYIMEHHQRSGSGNGLMISQMTDSFRMPKDFASLVYLSMVLQAEGIRYGVEHWRRNKDRVSGTLYWQLNDCWPVASWSSLDYFGRWKALHYAAKRFFAPVLLSIEDSGDLMDIHVTSDLNLPWSGMLQWKLMRINGAVLQSGEETVELSALETRKVLSKVFQLSPKEKRETVLVSELFSSNGAGKRSPLAMAIATFSPNKHLDLHQPILTMSVKPIGRDCEIQLTADSLARFVEISLEGQDVIFSDNYFDLPAGSTKVIRFTIPQDMDFSSLQERLKIRSLYDSFA
jgi:beta-mannosidase